MPQNPHLEAIYKEMKEYKEMGLYDQVSKYSFNESTTMRDIIDKNLRKAKKDFDTESKNYKTMRSEYKTAVEDLLWIATINSVGAES